jgi:hypothetical protein
MQPEACMEQPPSLEKEMSKRTGRKLWTVTLSVTALLVVIGIIFLLVGHHIGLPK